MKNWKLGLSFIAVLLAICTLGTGEARSQTFKFTICNNTGDTAAAATASHQSPGSSAYVVQGWFIVGPGSCRNIGNFYKGHFYYYAELYNNSSVQWSNGNQTCVRYPGPFEIITTGGDKCPSDELKGFHQKNITPNIGTYTWSLGN
jgi:uncharacterized membrane protein